MLFVTNKYSYYRMFIVVAGCLSSSQLDDIRQGRPYDPYGFYAYNTPLFSYRLYTVQEIEGSIHSLTFGTVV